MLLPNREHHQGDIEAYLTRGTGAIGREVTGCRRDGARFPMYLSVGEVRDQGRRVFVAVVHDLREHKRTEETRFRALADRAPLMIWMSRPDGVAPISARAGCDSPVGTSRRSSAMGGPRTCTPRT